MKQIRSIEDLRPDPQNANQGTERGRGMLEESLRELGAGRSVVSDKHGTMIAGNKTLEAAVDIGLPIRPVHTDGSELVVVVRDDLDLSDGDRARRLAYLDNRSSETGLDWDATQIAADLEAGLDLDGIWTADELGELMDGLDQGEPGEDPGPQIDRADELREKWGVEHGQLWEIPSKTMIGKSHRLMCGDSTNADDVRRLMGGERAALFATDPPYFVGYDGMNHPHKWNEPDKNKDWSEDYLDWDDPAQGEELYRAFISVAIQEAISDRAAWYCWHASRNQGLVEQIWEELGAFVHQQIIWVKDRPILTRSWYMWQHEPCFFGWIRGQKPKRVADNYPSGVWQIPTILPGKTTLHPTSKPIEVFAIPMKQHTYAGEICYEPFAGSGSQIVAAEGLGRRCYALEIAPQFVAVSLERLAGMGLEPRLTDKAYLGA